MTQDKEETVFDDMHAPEQQQVAKLLGKFDVLNIVVYSVFYITLCII